MTNFDEMAPDELFAYFENFVNGFSRASHYVDVLISRDASTSIQKNRVQEQLSLSQSAFGIVVRLFTDQWHEFGFQTPAEFDDISIKLQSFPSSSSIVLSEFLAWQCDETIIPQRSDLEVPLEEKLAKIRQIYQELQEFDSRIINPGISYTGSNQERIFLNNEGSRLRQVIPRTRLMIQPVVKEGDKQDFDYESISGEQGFELVENVSSEMISEIAQKSLAMLSAKEAPAGKLPVVLDSDMTGLIAHESFGHGLEADQILRKRSYLEPLFNSKVAADIVNISDCPSESHQIGSYFFDDEGTQAGKNLLVENGILTHYIYGRRSASEFNAIPQGNGRREDFLHRVNERMTNTYFEPGEYSLEEIFEGISSGVYLEKGFFGMEDPLGGGIQCTSKKGWLIENGEKTQLLGSVTLSGRVLDLLQSIDAITREPFKLSGGTCGKGSEDYVPVTSGGPVIRAWNTVIGPG